MIIEMMGGGIMEKTKLSTIIIFIIIGLISISGVTSYNNQWYTTRLITAIKSNDITRVEQLLKSPTGNVNARKFKFNIVARISD